MIREAAAPDTASTERLLALLIAHLKEEHGYTDSAITGILSKVELKKDQIPLGIFTPSLSPFETIVRYLVDEQGLKVRAVAEATNRSVHTVWATYRNARRKHPAPLSFSTDSSLTFPLSTLADRSFSPLESIVCYLKDRRGMGYHEIAMLLHRHDSTIWTVYSRAGRKKKA